MLTADDADAIANKTGAGSEAVIDAKMQQVCLPLSHCIEFVSVKCHHEAGTLPSDIAIAFQRLHGGRLV